MPATTARLAIEPLVPAHAAAFHAALDHPEVWQFVNGPDVTTISAQHARIVRLADGCPRPGERWWNFAVSLRDDGTMIGHLQATTYGTWGEIAYMFGPRWWGQGLCSEATAWLSRPPRRARRGRAVGGGPPGQPALAAPADPQWLRGGRRTRAAAVVVRLRATRCFVRRP